MFKNYLKIAFRNLSKNKLYTFVNMLGLSVAITSCVLVGLFIRDELSYDNFNTNADRIVRVTMDYSDAGTITATALNGSKAGPQLSRTFPQIENFARILKASKIISNGDKVFDEKKFLYADDSFFKIFSFPLIVGNAATALNAPGKIVITAKMAEKYFGAVNVVGKTLKISDGSVFEISGVAKNPPENSQIKFDFVASFSNLEASKNEGWWTTNYVTYLLLHNATQINRLQRQVTAYMASNRTRVATLGDGSNTTDYLTYHLEPLKKVHLYSSLNDGLEPNGNIVYVYILGIIGLLILVIACVNYTNLTIAQSSKRTAEIGIRKVMGAQRKQIFFQFMGESFLLVAAALIISLIAISQLMPLFNKLTGKSLGDDALFQPLLFASVILFTLLVSFLAGAYPAFLISGSKLISILKSGFHLTSSGKNVGKLLIVFQFTISTFLIAATIIIIQQLSYIRNKDVGYDKDHVIVLPVDAQMRNKYQRFKDALLLSPQVKSVSGAYETPVLSQWGDGLSVDAGSQKERISNESINLSLNSLPVALDFTKTMGMQLLAGTDFTEADLALTDTSNHYKNFRYSFILNETAAKELGWTPQQAVGKTLDKGKPGTVKAVVKDFHFASFHQPIGPMVLVLDTSFVRQMLVNVSGTNMPAILQFLQTTWKQYVNNRPFEYRFMNEDYAHLYSNEEHAEQVFSVFSIIAILLACLGLFAMASYATIQRTKEMGIRKVLGADVLSITALLSKDFIKLIALAVLIATPVAWFAMNKWLQGFAYRINIQWWVFLITGIVALVIALLTITFHAIKAAIGNPVESLRSE